MKRRNVKLPRLRHRFERARTKHRRVDRNPPPAENTEPLRIGSRFDGASRILNGARRKKRESQPKVLGQLDMLLGGTRTEKRLRNRGQQPGAVAARAVGIDAAPVSQPLQRV